MKTGDPGSVYGLKNTPKGGEAVMNRKMVMRGIGIFLLIMAGGILGREGYPAES